MKQVAIVGFGMGTETLTAEGLCAIEQADVLIGARRLAMQLEHLGKPFFAEYEAEAVANIIRDSWAQYFCVLVSGDTGFYSAATGLCEAVSEYAPTLIPGISSLSYFFARLGLSWQDAALVSCHGRKGNLVDTVRRSALTFALTGGNTEELGKSLEDAGFGELTVHVGENLGMREERIFTLSASGLAAAGIGNLTVLLVENPGHDSRIRFGIPDREFLRGNVPMTKAEVRAATMSKLAISPDEVCCDIGAGTGSVTVEMALAAYKGRVYALDHKQEAIDLAQANCRAFHIGNVTPILGAVPEALEALPPMDAAFIGGSSGRLGEIMDALLAKNPYVRMVVNAVTLETLQAAMEAYTAHGITPEIVQIGATRIKAVGAFHMLDACSPVFILSGGGNG